MLLFVPAIKGVPPQKKLDDFFEEACPCGGRLLPDNPGVARGLSRGSHLAGLVLVGAELI